MRNSDLICAVFIFSAALALGSTSKKNASCDAARKHSAQHEEDKIQNVDQLYKFQFSENEKQSDDKNRFSFIAENPQSFHLFQNYPNPFNHRTFLKFELENDAQVSLDIYDARGRDVAHLLSSQLSKGVYLAPWDATNEDGEVLTSGVYYARLRNAETSKIIRMVLLR